ncbi:hypothetical protein Pmar_PMAR003833 [Perkinsus marinus ATCC 50983]|uniref:Uncharacterized protein n=1 Tax=Perkinsus marinus (strain ATCC 50983 / TXsc) TaxID=423536 RepID=C5KKS7_PERM5|nr:hypothetical protein Pmar_PMAR003833 [Perkinsus marinus ATCC 50983]EER14916.1 hypothetical protein Pmar_PMAR003833 [Perkinsus marinus ATCC 50983]|eukprot:XP_002783120.1 hypothetical protein Pmar_PMAR003833 [Perkinsus marinus ATCC 50983]
MFANDRADELAAKGASMMEVSAETEISVKTLRHKRAGLGTCVNDFFYCASHARLWSRGEVTPAGSAVVFEHARKRVKGGVPYHFYKMVVDLKRRKAFNRLFLALMQHLDARRGLL